MALFPSTRITDRLFGSSPFALFAFAGLLGTVAIGVGGLVASQRAGESDAMSDVRVLTQVVAKTVVEPNLTSALVEGDPKAIAQLDAIVDARVLDETTIRVKLWDASGRIVYSDKHELIGERYELDDDKVKSLTSGLVVSERSDALEGAENRFEAAQADRLLEVYLPIDGPTGDPLLYESYFAISAVSDSAARIRAEFVPIVVASLVLLEAMHLGLAWGLRRRMQRSQEERERLLQQAIDSSDRERRRVAGDLHDGVVQDLVGTSFAVAAAAESAERFGPELASDLRAAAVGTRRSLQSLRSLLVDIYPPNLHQQGLEAALVDLLAPAASVDIETDLVVAGDLDSSPEAVALTYRVAQEAVRNALRHAEATSLAVEVEASGEHLFLTVSDNGRGFQTADPSPEGHLGLRLLSDLAADAGATFAVSSDPGAGTTIRLKVLA